MAEQLDFAKSIARRLDEAEIPYMWTGSFALSLYAQPRMTRDLDLVVELRDGDVDTVVGLFESDCYIEPNMVRKALASHGMFNVIHRELVLKADLIVKKDEPYRVLEFSRRGRHDLDGLQVSVVSPEDLLLSKLVWAQDSDSAAQLNDVRSLLRSTIAFDWTYLLEWATRLGVVGHLEELRTQ